MKPGPPKGTPGQFACPRRAYWATTLGLSERQRRRLRIKLLDQLDACKSVEAQRILIRGIGGR